MRLVRILTVTLAVIGTTTGCLGTMVGDPPQRGRVFSSTSAHILALPTQLASPCEKGLQHVFTFVPLWGLAVGILTIGIVVPMTTQYSSLGGSR